MNKLKIIIYWNPITNKYNAEVPERPSVGVVEGDTSHDVIDAVEAVLVPPSV